MNFDLARRRFLYRSLTGLGGIALSDLHARRYRRRSESARAEDAAPHSPRPKSCIFLTMLGGVSQMDSFDPKPALEKFDNTVMDWSKEKNTDQANLFAKPRLILRSAFPFQKYGQCGTDVSEPVPAHRHLRGRHGVRAVRSRRRTAITRPRYS